MIMKSRNIFGINGRVFISNVCLGGGIDEIIK